MNGLALFFSTTPSIVFPSHQMDPPPSKLEQTLASARLELQQATDADGRNASVEAFDHYQRGVGLLAQSLDLSKGKLQSEIKDKIEMYLKRAEEILYSAPELEERRKRHEQLRSPKPRATNLNDVLVKSK